MLGLKKTQSQKHGIINENLNLIDFKHLDKHGENFVSLDNFVNFEDIKNFAYLVKRKKMKIF